MCVTLDVFGGDQIPIPRFSSRQIISHGVQEGQRVNTEPERQSSRHYLCVP